MMEEILANVTQIILILSFIWAVWKFGLYRERSSFLQIGVTTKVIDHVRSLALILVTVRLENLGNIRIDARTKNRDEEGFLYEDDWDKCMHAGTLKVRRIPRSKKFQHFDWYSLEPISLPYSLNIPQTTGTEPQSDFEQINYLDEYQDPELEYREVHFWLEPKEKYELNVFLWLPSGSYAVKAIFLSNQTKHKEEEYWSHTTLFSVSHSAKKHTAV